MNINKIKEQLREVVSNEERTRDTGAPDRSAPLSLWHNTWTGPGAPVSGLLPAVMTTAERDHFRAQMTALQEAGTAHVYERRGMLARCAGQGRERNGDVEHHPRWLVGWDAADELLKRDAADLAPEDPVFVRLQAAADAAATKVDNLEAELRRAARAADIERQRIWAALDGAKAQQKAAQGKLEEARCVLPEDPRGYLAAALGEAQRKVATLQAKLCRTPYHPRAAYRRIIDALDVARIAERAWSSKLEDAEAKAGGP